MRGAVWGTLLTTAVACGAGCSVAHPHAADAPYSLVPPVMPRELNKVVLPTYTIEPPDILVIEAIHIVPRSPYLLRTSDVIAVNATNLLPDAPIAGAYPIQPGGIVNLGLPYGAAKVSGMTVEQAQDEVKRVLSAQVREPVVT